MTIYEKVFGTNRDESDETCYMCGCPSNFGFKDLEGEKCSCTSCADCWNRPAEGNALEEPKEPHILDSGNRREFESGVKEKKITMRHHFLPK